MGDAYSHVRSAHRLSAGPRRSRGGCSGVAVAPTEEGGALVFAVAAVFLVLLLRAGGGFFPPARRSGHIGIEAFRHILYIDMEILFKTQIYVLMVSTAAPRARPRTAVEIVYSM